MAKRTQAPSDDDKGPAVTFEDVPEDVKPPREPTKDERKPTAPASPLPADVEAALAKSHGTAAEEPEAPATNDPCRMNVAEIRSRVQQRFDDLQGGLPSFLGRRVQFLSRHSGQVTYPCGSPGHEYVDGHYRPRVAKEVKFEDHQYETHDAQVALGLVLANNYFDREWGWSINHACLPMPIRGEFARLHPTNKQTVVVAMIEGFKAEDALLAIDHDLEKKAHDRSAGNPENEQAFVCQVCHKVARGKNEQEALGQHRRLMHPETLTER
ncbi:MAG TPA: hypothetical protein VMX12_06720 [Acidimicrobiia bacterium]|nr:hypothetical protein [Acidimicrobiia bacterium]